MASTSMTVSGKKRVSSFRKALLAAPLLALALTGCDTVGDWFGAAKEPPLPGTRISVLKSGSNLTVDQEVASVAVTLPAAATNADWPQAGGSADHAAGHVSLADSPRQVWSTSIGSGTGSNRALLGTPVVADGKVFAMDAQSRVVALDANSGQKIWSIETQPEKERGEASGGGIAYGEGRLFAGTGYAELISIDPANGSVQWRKRLSGPVRGAPTVQDGRVYILTLDNQLYALSVADGTEQWTHQGILETAGLLGAVSPAATNTLVVAPYSSGELYGLRPETGRVAFQESLSGSQRGGAISSIADIRALPVIDNGIILAVGHAGRMVAIDERIGNRLWEVEIGGIQTPAVAGDFVFVLSNNAELVAMTRKTGQIRWIAQLERFEDPEDRKGPIVWAGPVAAGGRLWLTSSTGQLVGVSPVDGQISVRQSIPSGSTLPPVVANNTLYVLSDNGTLSAHR